MFQFTSPSQLRPFLPTLSAAMVAAVSLIVPAAATHADLVIDSSDIVEVGGEKTYSYDVTPTDMQNNGAQVIDDMTTFNNMNLNNGGSTLFFAATGDAGYKTAG